MDEVTERRTGAIQSVERAARILRAVGDRQQVGVGELGAVLGVHKSTASRLVSTLVAEGFLQPGSEPGTVRLGQEIRRLGRVASGGANLAEIAREPLDKLAGVTGETVTLSVRDGDYALTIAQSGGTHRIGVNSWVGARTPLPLTADGKVLLAYGIEESTTSRSLRAELARVREAEWASARGELEENLFGVAAPVWDDDQRCLGAVCVSGPSYRVSVDRFEELADRCRHTAYEIADLRRHHEELA